MRKPKYKTSVPSRFFLKANKPLLTNEIWFHVCSFGEAISLKPLVNRFSSHRLGISTITATGHAQAKKLIDNVRYLPFEIFIPFWRVKTKVLVVLEAELWYMLFGVVKARGVKTVLLNARISDSTFHKYVRMRFFYRQLFKQVDQVFCQNPIDKERLEFLGAKNVEVIGNIKLASMPVVTKTYEKPAKKLIVAASTHDSEERLILNSYIASEDEVLVVVPRHPERFETVDALLSKHAHDNKLSYHKFSEKADFSSDVVLVDCLGELVNIYAISELVILGGAFNDKVGGHNPIEPAYFETKVVTGLHYFNQKSLMPLVTNLVETSCENLKTVLKNRQSIQPTKIEGSVDLTPFYTYIENVIKE